MPLIIELLNKGYEITLIASEDDYANNLKDLGCKFYEINFKRKSFNIFENFHLIFLYYFLIKKINPNYIFLFTIKPNIFVTISQIFRNVKIINNITGLGTLVLKGKIIKNLFLCILKIIFIKSFKVITHNSNDLELIKDKFNKNDKFLVIPSMGINLEKYKFKKKIFNSQNKRLNFIFIGRLIEDKGIYEYLQAAELINLKHSNIQFSILGEIDKDNHKPVTKIIISKYSKFKFIKFYKYQKDIRNILYKHDCLVLPSYREGLPRVLLEALSMGIPVLASSVPGCSSLIINNKTGILFEPKNIDSLIKAIEKFSKLENEKISKMILNGYNHVKLNFDQKKIVKNYINILNS